MTHEVVCIFTLKRISLPLLAMVNLLCTADSLIRFVQINPAIGLEPIPLNDQRLFDLDPSGGFLGTFPANALIIQAGPATSHVGPPRKLSRGVITIKLH